MSYYFAIIGTLDNPLFEHGFGTSKAGGDGLAHFPEASRHMNQFVAHSSLDIVEEIQWASSLPSSSSLTGTTTTSATSSGQGPMYLKCVDRFFNSYVSCFMTGGNVKFLLLHQPLAIGSVGGGGVGAGGIGGGGGGGSSRSSTSIAANPTSPQTEEAVKNFMVEVYENWVKTIMSPFYRVNTEVRSPVFRQRVAAAGRKYL